VFFNHAHRQWVELRQGNIAVAMVVGAVVIAFALVVAAAIPSPSLPR
jgi:uncharacterized membrane protein YjfL (UPF0719 family)